MDIGLSIMIRCLASECPRPQRAGQFDGRAMMAGTTHHKVLIVGLARPLWPRAFARQTPDHYTQPNVHRRPTSSRRPQIFRTRTTAEAKCGMRGSRLDQALLSGMLCRGLASWSDFISGGT